MVVVCLVCHQMQEKTNYYKVVKKNNIKNLKIFKTHLKKSVAHML